ncbi:hypothetical protein FC754_16230 [Clostridium botulinum]|nr:hypothetical protein [Clostridium botulinum]
MDVTKFNEKFNRVDGKIYVVEEVVTPVGGLYEAELTHDNINNLNVYTGSKLTGTKITTYSTSTPSLTPWKTVIKIFSTEPQLYISYETTGDQVEAEDINNLQDAINLTQEELNKENNRATSRENNIEKDLNSEITRAKNAESTENTRAINRENLIEKNLDLEVERAKASEKVLTDNLNTEINRAKGSEKTISDNLSSEVNRAKVKENSIESNFNNYKTSNDSEIQGLKAKDIDLENKKANLDYVNLELNKRYTKDQTFTREEVLKKIQDLIGTAPDTLDTFKEIADALGNDPNFATTIMNELSSKVDKVTGKSLSTNDYDNTEKSKLSDVNAKKHEHSNKSIIDKITQGLLDAWNSAYNHINDSIRHITSSERNLWNTVSDKANKTDIPSKLSQLTNDKKFITQDDIDTSQNHIHNNKSVLDKISQKTLDDINLSVDKVLKNKLTPIETDSTLTKLDNCIGEYVHNMQIRGKTLQNLVTETVNAIKEYSNFCFSDLLKPDTTYTLIANNSSDVNYNCYLNEENFITGGNLKLPKGLSIKKTITKNTITNNIVLKNFTGGNTSFTLENIMLLEGDWTNKEIPPYFEGIKSTGELEGNKISILSCGKNLLETDFTKWVSEGDSISIENNIIKVEGKLTESNRVYGTFNCSKNISYTASIEAKAGNIVNGMTNPYRGISIAFFNKGKYMYEYGLGVDTGTYDWKTFKLAFTPRPNVPFDTIEFQLYLRDHTGTIWYKNIQLEEGITATPYEEHKEDKTEILTGTEPLMFNDTIDLDNNKLIRETQKIILNNNPTIKWCTLYNASSANTLLFGIADYDTTLGESTGKELCDSFVIDNDNIWQSDKQSIQFISGSSQYDNKIRIRIAKSELIGYSDSMTESQKIGLFKNYLSSKPVVIYCSKIKTIEKLNIKDTLQAFENGYIQLNNAITPTTQLEYSTNLPSVLSGVVEIQDKILDRVNILEKKKSITWDELEGV